MNTILPVPAGFAASAVRVELSAASVEAASRVDAGRSPPEAGSGRGGLPRRSAVLRRHRRGQVCAAAVAARRGAAARRRRGAGKQAAEAADRDGTGPDQGRSSEAADKSGRQSGAAAAVLAARAEHGIGECSRSLRWFGLISGRRHLDGWKYPS